MKLIYSTLMAFVLGAGALLAADEKQDDLKQVQAERYAAMVNRDVKQLDEILADDLVYSHSDGMVETKEDFIKTIKSGYIQYFDLEDLEVEVRNRGNFAILNGVVQMDCILGNASRGLVNLNFTAVYEKRDGKWILTTWQTTRAKKQPKVPQPPKREQKEKQSS